MTGYTTVESHTGLNLYHMYMPRALMRKYRKVVVHRICVPDQLEEFVLVKLWSRQEIKSCSIPDFAHPASITLVCLVVSIPWFLEMTVQFETNRMRDPPPLPIVGNVFCRHFVARLHYVL